MGRATTVSNAAEADIVLTEKESKGKKEKKKGGYLVFQWDELVSYLRENRFP